MKNTVVNFSLHADEFSRTIVTALASAEPHPLSVDAGMPAHEVAEMALRNEKEIVIVKRDNELAGIFVAGYLRDVLPELSLGMGLNLRPDMQLPEMIALIDKADIAFHSESVNHFPTLRKCPKGHVTSGDPCPRHRVATKPYP